MRRADRKTPHIHFFPLIMGIYALQRRSLIVFLLLVQSVVLIAKGNSEETELVNISAVMAIQPVQDNADINDYYIFNHSAVLFDINWDIFSFPVDQAKERMQILYTAEELPDLLFGSYVVKPILYEAINTDQLQVLDDYIADSTGWSSNPYWDLIKTGLPYFDGKTYTLAGATLATHNVNGGGRYFYDRYIINELGLSEPETLDELTSLFRIVQEKYPDKIILSGLYNSQRVTDFFMNAFGMKGDMWGTELGDHINVINGKILFSYEHEHYKPYLEYIHMLFKEGILDPEYFSQQSSQLASNGRELRYFMASHTTQILLVGNNENVFRYTPAKPLTSEYNPRKWWPRISGIKADGAAITSSSANPERVWDFLDWMGTREAQAIFMGYVEENVLIEEAIPDGLTRDNIICTYDAMGILDNPIDMLGMGQWLFSNTYIAPRASSFINVSSGSYPQGEFAYDPEIIGNWFSYQMNETYPDYYIENLSGRDFKFTGEEQNELAMYTSELTEYIDEMQAKFFLGIEPISNYNAFQDGLKKRHIDRIRAIYQTAYERMIK